MNLSQKDKSYLWHPYTQQFNGLDLPIIVRGAGAWLYDDQNRTFLDGISSWWVTLFGHNQPEIVAAIKDQVAVLEQVIFAGFSHPPAISLAENLLSLLKNKYSKVFLSDNGSTAVEVALKIALQYFKNQEVTKKSKIICLENSYHGDTFGAMAVSERSIFTWAFQDLLFDVISIPVPADYESIKLSTEILSPYFEKEEIAAFIYEPLLQGAGGMRIYSAEHLNTLIELFKNQHVICIADEVFTGFFRTGTFLASQQLALQPDIICLSKALTGGFLPLGATIVTEQIYSAFHQPEKRKMLFHGHSFTANPLACAAANATIALIQQPTFEQFLHNYCLRQKHFAQTLSQLSIVSQERHLGMLVAADLHDSRPAGYTNPLSTQLSAAFQKKGIILRPLGNTLYLLPPLFIKDTEHQWLYETCITVLESI